MYAAHPFAQACSSVHAPAEIMLGLCEYYMNKMDKYSLCLTEAMDNNNEEDIKKFRRIFDVYKAKYDEAFISINQRR